MRSFLDDPSPTRDEEHPITASASHSRVQEGSGEAIARSIIPSTREEERTEGHPLATHSSLVRTMGVGLLPHLLPAPFSEAERDINAL